MMSLPTVLGTTLQTIPATVPYVSAAPVDIARCAERLRDVAGLKVGLVWATGPKADLRLMAKDGRRSAPLASLKPVLEVADVHFVSLQKGAGQEIASLDERLRPINFMAEMKDFADTAALMANVDLVITVCTSVAHLAGAMGKPVWILLRFDGCWRWLLNRDNSPWYPTARLFRQTTHGNWDEVAARVAEALRAKVTERSA